VVRRLDGSIEWPSQREIADADAWSADLLTSAIGNDLPSGELAQQAKSELASARDGLRSKLSSWLRAQQAPGGELSSLMQIVANRYSAPGPTRRRASWAGTMNWVPEALVVTSIRFAATEMAVSLSVG